MEPQKQTLQFRATIFVISSAIVLFMVGCATHKPKESPFKVPLATIRETTKTIAIFHLENKEPVEGEFAKQIGTKLRAAGFLVVEPNQIAPFAEKESKAIGDLYDPKTGKIEKTKEDAYWQHVLQELRTNLNVDGIIFFDIEEKLVEYEGGDARISAQWDGTKQDLIKRSQFEAYFGTVLHWGKAPALSVKITLQDMQRRVLFENYGGIQLAAKMRSLPLGRMRYEDIPRNELLMDSIRNQNAVNIALYPLTKIEK